MGNKAGSVWNINQIDLNQPFDYSFTVNLGCNNTSQWVGADGMVFALQPLNTSIGSSGGQMGLGGVSPSLGVYLDTYQNTAHGDIFNDHISINKLNQIQYFLKFPLLYNPREVSKMSKH